MPDNANEAQKNAQTLALWDQATKADWSQASAEDALDGLRLAHRARSGNLLDRATFDATATNVQLAMASRALILGKHLGEEPMHPKQVGCGSISSFICHQAPDIYQKIMAFPEFTWRSAASWGVHHAKAWAAAPGAEGLERFVALMITGFPKTENARKSSEQAHWDLSWWMRARPQDKPLAKSGAALGAARLSKIAATGSAEAFASQLRRAQSILEMIHPHGLAADLQTLMAKAERDLEQLALRESRAQKEKAVRDHSLAAWNGGVTHALRADQPTMLKALLPALEEQWPGSALGSGAQALTEPSFFEQAIDHRAKKCAGWLLTQKYPLKLTAKNGLANIPAFFTDLARQAQHENSSDHSWSDVLADAEERALKEFSQLGCDAQTTERAIETMCAKEWPGTRSKKELAQKEAFQLRQSERLARVREKLAGQERPATPSTPSARL
jgi:hypothetical protein